MRGFIILAMVFLAVQATPDKLRQGRRGGRQEDLDLRAEENLPAYEEEPLETYGDLDVAASEAREADAGLDMLMKSVPGIPGEDYPIYSEAPETAFACDG